METVTITLNSDQARALAHWVNEFYWEHSLKDTLAKPVNAQYLEVFNAINDANERLNPPKIRILA